MSTLKNLLKTFAFPAAIFLFHVLVLIPSGIYSANEWLDIPMHFLGGFAVSLSFIYLLNQNRNKNEIKIPRSVQFIFIVAIVALTAVLWEFVEFTIDFFLRTNAQRGLPDTMLDLFLGIVGGALGALIYSKPTPKTEELSWFTI